MGSTRALTDDAGDVSDTYVYDAWGNEVSVSGSTVNPFRWVGQVGYYWDEGLGTFYIRARVYEPMTGLWLSKDPASALGQETYKYARNNPVFLADPFGLEPLIIEPGGYQPNCQCGQAQMRWRMYPQSQFAYAYIVQKVCLSVYAHPCDTDCSGACVPRKRAKTCAKCFYELLGITWNDSSRHLEDAWRTPHIVSPATITGESVVCLSFGFAAMWAWVRGTELPTVETSPPWKPAGTMKCGDFEINVGKHLESEPGWWSKQAEWVKYSGSNAMFTAWNCCPRPDDKPHGFMGFSSSSSFPSWRACKGDFEPRGP